MTGFLLATAGAVMAATGPAVAAPPTTASPVPDRVVAYVRGGDLYLSRGPGETRLTTGGGYARPRWSPDGRRLAYLNGGRLWTMNADGTGRRRLTTRAAAGPGWSPDGAWIAFGSLSCTGGPGVYRISATVPSALPQVLFPAECRTEPVPAEPAILRPAGDLTQRLRTDDAVAWSPDGTRLAFRGGDCDSVYDDCLSVGTLATGAERVIAAFGGGGLMNSGFAVVPSWRSDGAKLSWTTAQQGETTAGDEPVHVVEYDTATRTIRTVGAALDREMVYLDGTHGVATGQLRGRSWLVIENLATGTRTPFHPGSQPTVRPAA